MQKVDYRNFRPDKINTPEFEHIKLLAFWPVFGLIFGFLERFWVRDYHYISCSIDSRIPFCEYFVIPYYFWFVFLIGIQVYGFFFDIPTFKNYMKYTIITYTVTLIVYLIYPTAQNLRPLYMQRHNVFTSIVMFLYGFDTNTNVCPSMHVLGSMAVCFAANKSRAFKAIPWRIAFAVMTVLISVSTVFLKQHSLLDVLYAVILGIAAYPFVYSRKITERKKEQYASV